MRLKNSLKNIVWDLIYNFVLIGFNFILRKQLINIVGIELIGLQNILNQALNVLSLAELGISSVITYSLYKPIKKNDENKIAQIMILFKSFYTKVALSIFTIGLLFLPFLHYFINEYTLNINYFFVYILFLIQTSTSYLFSYKMVLMEADQKAYMYKRILCILKIITFIIELVVFLITENYYLYLILNIIDAISTNYIISKFVSNKYLYLKNNKKKLNSTDVKEIKDGIKNIFIGKVSGIITSSSDTFILSCLSTVSVVGIYSNYYTILYAIQKIVQKIISNMKSSIANKIIGENKEVELDIYNTLNFLTFLLAIFCSITYYNVIRLIITLWLGTDYTMSNVIEITFSIQLFIMIFRINLWQFTTIEGLFRINKLSSIIGAITNIVLSIVLYFVFNVSGIIIATIVSQLIQYFMKEYYLCKKTKIKLNSLLKNDFKNIFTYTLIITISIILKKYIPTLLSLLIALSILLIFILLFYKKTTEFKNVISYTKKTLAIIFHI